MLSVTRVAASQPLGDHPDDDPRLHEPTDVARPHSLVDAAREGAASLATARLDRLTDMATIDLAPLDDGTTPEAPEEVAPESPTAPAVIPDAARSVAWRPRGRDRVDRVRLRRHLAARRSARRARCCPVQVSLASRGARAVALVAMGRPGADRHGMAFPESRWVEWNDGRVEVFPARGFLPGAALALGDRDATVISYTRPDPRTPQQRASRILDVDVATQVAVTRVDARGHVIMGPNELEGSDGWQIDSPVVVWRHGIAVVLGHPTAPPGDGARREVLHFLDARGHDVRAPLELSIDSRDARLRRRARGAHRGARREPRSRRPGWSRRGPSRACGCDAGSLSKRSLSCPAPRTSSRRTARRATPRDAALRPRDVDPPRRSG